TMEGTPRKAGAVLLPRSSGERKHIRRQGDHDPMPEAGRRRRVGIEAGDGKTLGLLGRASPRQVGGTVRAGERVSSSHRGPVTAIVAIESERTDSGEQVVWIGGDGSVEIHVRLNYSKDSGTTSRVARLASPV